MYHKNAIYVFLILALLSPLLGGAQTTNNERLKQILLENVDSLKGIPGNWQFDFEELAMLCLTDEANNRMRILTPIADADDLNSEEIKKCLEANFHTALDVKYAISENVVWVVFIHPLKELSDNQVIDALYQVYNATATFGTSYSSTHLVFPENKRKVNKKPKLKIDKS